MIAALFVAAIIGAIFSALIGPGAGFIAFVTWMAVSVLGLFLLRQEP